MSLDEGRLNQRIQVERENLVDNGKGGRKRPDGEEAWLPVAKKVWAECYPLRGGEALQNVVQRSSQLWRVTIRARPGITTSHRLTWYDPLIGDVVGNIRSIAPNEDRDGLVMTVESGKA